MIESVGRRLRVVFQHPPEPSADDAPPTRRTTASPEVEFIAYAEDCLLQGHVRLGGGRLTDLLNEHDEYVLVDVLVTGLADGTAHEVKEVSVARDELLLVHATGPRGDRGRRHRTRQHPLALEAGPYHVRGYLHALPGTDPVAAFRRRKPMVPLTDASIEYVSGSTRQRRRVSTVIVNRHQVDWVGEALDDEVEMPDLPVKAETGPLVKDFTGAILGGLDGPANA